MNTFLNKLFTEKNISILLLGILFYFSYQTWLHDGGLHYRSRQLAKETAILLKDNSQLQQENEKLAAEVADLKNGFEATTEIARHNFGFIQHNELYYSLQPN